MQTEPEPSIRISVESAPYQLSDRPLDRRMGPPEDPARYYDEYRRLCREDVGLSDSHVLEDDFYDLANLPDEIVDLIARQEASATQPTDDDLPWWKKVQPLPGGIVARGGGIELFPGCCCTLASLRSWSLPTGPLDVVNPDVGHEPFVVDVCRSETLQTIDIQIHIPGPSMLASRQLSFTTSNYARQLATASDAVAAFARRLQRALEHSSSRYPPSALAPVLSGLEPNTKLAEGRDHGER